MIEIVVLILLIISAVFSILGVIGLFRFPDFYTRVHAAGLIGSFGLLFAAAGVIVFAANEIASGNAGYTNFIFHAAFAIVIILITATTSTHIIARGAHKSGHLPKVSVNALQEEKK
ncbi:MAG TPA: monovalent cation/H(+) antiporter subunit G [Methanocorpusculum sp.]|nr:monovalent cation/H(+) antiporter subunit G [Methanocorpusculum sp.]